MVPGPWIESAAYLPLARTDVDLTESRTTVAMPYAVDADVADEVYALVDGELHTATAERRVTSIDPSRHLFTVTAGEPVAHGDLDAAYDLAVLATAAQLLGAGERVLADSVAYVKQRTQFGRAIGSYQAIKHQLADARIALDFARPLVFGAALELTPRSVSAAKLQAAEAANLAARVGLQVHGAIGYTEEYDLSRWLLRIRALQSAWGTASFHRERLLASLLADQSLSPSK
ncbi:acyl-CoA dehydrogenase family protein [Aeromicrobium ginsengisoli]|uniref:acyl-CoA dehydrogenase family protein n=1 Tax=Aeromicrobium ginsengisoli TaxID=363867 RepID=UPI001FEB595D|nr:acyl-CoA dehydrogenase family protein [Aeromicrobium ginsengisoli]